MATKNVLDIGRKVRDFSLKDQNQKTFQLDQLRRTKCYSIILPPVLDTCFRRTNE
jgi:hypothetical protein